MKKKIIIGLTIAALLLGFSVATATITMPPPPDETYAPRMVYTSLSAADVKALEWDIVDIGDWTDNFLSVKAEKCKDRLITFALQDETMRQQIAAILISGNQTLVMDVQSLPQDVKDSIVLAVNVESAAQRSQEPYLVK